MPELVYEPYGSAVEVFKSRDRVIFVDGPVRTGKSRGCIEKVHLCLLKYAGARALFVRQTMRSMRSTLLVTYEDDVLGNTTVGQQIKGGASRETRAVYHYPNGSSITLAGLDDINKILSGEYDLIYIQQAEECAFNDVQMLTTRLSGKTMPYRQMLGDCNPGPPTHWIKQKEAEGWLRLIPSNHTENPVLFDREKQEWTPFGADYIANLDQMQGHLKDRMRHGLWVAAEGARFPQLDPKVHRFSMRELWPKGLPDHYRVIMGVDYGLAAPYCALWIAIDPEKNAYVFREDYEKGLTADVQARRMVSLTGENEKVAEIWPDPTIWAKFPGHQGPTHKCTGDYYEAEFRKYPKMGPIMRSYHGADRRRMGFDTIDVMLNRDNDHPNLYIEQSCVNLWREMNEAVWDQNTVTGAIREDIRKECADHAITALYYPLTAYYAAASEPAQDYDHKKAMAQRYQEMIEDDFKRFDRGNPAGGKRRLRV